MPIVTVSPEKSYAQKELLKAMGWRFTKVPTPCWYLPPELPVHSYFSPTKIYHKKGLALPMLHQLRALKAVLYKQRVACAFGIGTGKTLPTLLFAQSMSDKNNPIKLQYTYPKVQDRVGTEYPPTTVVICPSEVIDVWRREFFKWCDEDYIHPCFLDQKTSAKKAKTLRLTSKEAFGMGKALLVVVSYSSYWRKDIADILLDTPIALLTFDECHYLKDPRTKQVLGAWNLSRNAIHRIIQTGTFTGNSPLDLWSQYQILDWRVFGMKRQDYLEEFAVESYDGFSYVWRPEGLRRIKERTGQYTLYVSDAEKVRLPALTEQKLYCVSTPAEAKEYNSIDNEFPLADLTEKYALSGRLENRIKVCIPPLLNVQREGEQAVVFCQHTETINLLAEALNRAGITYSILDGSRKEEGNWLNSNTTTLITQYQCGSAGKNWQNACVTIFAEPTWSFLTWEQARGRVHRSGQTQRVCYYYVLSDLPIDVDIYAALSNKQDFHQWYHGKNIKSY